MESTIYTVDGKEFELKHYGVKGMKWGRRKARPQVMGVGRRGGGSASGGDSPEAQAAAKEARRQKAKKALKIGAAVAGAALAAYGTYKVAQYMQGKRNSAAAQKAQNYIDNNFFHRIGDTGFADGTRRMDFATRSGNELSFQGSRKNVGRDVGAHNAKVMNTANRMYRDATNTRLDRGLAKVVGAGDAVGDAAKRAGTKVGDAAKRAGTKVGNAAKNTARKTKNAVLDVVNPIYEYSLKPGARPASASGNFYRHISELDRRRVRRR